MGFILSDFDDIVNDQFGRVVEPYSSINQRISLCRIDILDLCWGEVCWCCWSSPCDIPHIEILITIEDGIDRSEDNILIGQSIDCSDDNIGLREDIRQLCHLKVTIQQLFKRIYVVFVFEEIGNVAETWFLEDFITVELEDVNEVRSGADGMDAVVCTCTGKGTYTTNACASDTIEYFMKGLSYLSA